MDTKRSKTKHSKIKHSKTKHSKIKHNVTKRNLHKTSTTRNIATDQYPRAAILPHAGKAYAGDARNNIFRYFPHTKIRYIIYISAIHNSHNIPPNIYQLHKDKAFGKTPLLPILTNNEHSFQWVEAELRSRFPGAKILTITPVKQHNDSKIVNWIVGFMKKHPNCILFSTTDLIHHGDQFNNKLLTYPQRLHKQHLEESFIHSLIHYPMSISTIKKHTQQQHLMCGPYAILLFSKIIQLLHYRGKVVDYYDSHLSDDKLNNYTIPFSPIKTLVSYVSIIYGSHIYKEKV